MYSITNQTRTIRALTNQLFSLPSDEQSQDERKKRQLAIFSALEAIDYQSEVISEVFGLFGRQPVK